MRRVCGWLLFFFATLWAGGIMAAPRVVGMGAEHPGFSVAGALVFVAGGVVCHQRPERSFHAAGVQYPVCARCTGIYLAAPVGVLAMLLVGAAWRPSFRRWRVILLVAVLPTLVSIILERVGGPSDMVSRALAAVPLGAAAAAFVAVAVLGHFAYPLTGPGRRV
jgi:uncharacterized membrane protein